MTSTPTFWLDGYEQAPLRKRLAYFRPWIEDRSVWFVGDHAVAEEYVRTLASKVCEDGPADLVFAPGVSAAALEEACRQAHENGSAFVGWTGEEAAPFHAQTLFQARDWPFTIHDGAACNSVPIFVLPGSLEPLRHPSVGIAIPTHSHPRAALEAIAAYAAEYPGETRFALVANGVPPQSIDELKKAVSFDRGRIELIAFDDNRGYGRGCNAGLAALMQHPDLDFLAVSNDDVLPGTDCLYEIVRAIRELEALGHNPGAAGPVSNEISGLQQIAFGPIADVAEMRAKAMGHWKTHHSSANQALQLRGLLLVFTRPCLDAVGGFDPRFGMGNFEDDDHNLRTRLGGFTLWVATGAFLFHHGSSTFKSIQIDYEANIRRNAEVMTRKWGLERLEDWITLEKPPAGVSVHQPFVADVEAAHTIRINGESVDLVHQASDVEFAAWIIGQPAATSEEGRKALIDWLSKRRKKAA